MTWQLLILTIALGEILWKFVLFPFNPSQIFTSMLQSDASFTTINLWLHTRWVRNSQKHIFYSVGHYVTSVLWRHNTPSCRDISNFWPGQVRSYITSAKKSCLSTWVQNLLKLTLDEIPSLKKEHELNVTFFLTKEKTSFGIILNFLVLDRFQRLKRRSSSIYECCKNAKWQIHI